MIRAYQAVLAAGSLLCGFHFQGFAADSAEITVAAAASLKDALGEIGRTYERAHPGVRIYFNFGGSGTLQKQIENGAPAHLFISADLKNMDELEKKGMIEPGSRRELLQNELVVIVPSSAKLLAFKDLAASSVGKIAIGAPETVPAGRYAIEVFQHFKILESVKPKLLLAKDVRSVLAYVESGNVDAGAVYRTDAAASRKVKIAASAPPGSHSRILYPAALLRGGRQAKLAKEFLEYLETKEIRELFAKYGFKIPRKEE